MLDARTAAECNVSWLPGAVRIADGEELLGVAPQGEASLEQTIVVCCSVGLRSAAVVNELRQWASMWGWWVDQASRSIPQA